jgi:hypothetical protein
MNRKLFVALLVLCLGKSSFAQFSGSSFFNTAPWSQLGTVTNNLTITDTANGFIVSGQVVVNVPSTSTPISGILASWIVDRPLAWPYGPANLTTTTVLDGFSQPPPGSAGTTSGSVMSIYTDYLGTPVSMSSISMTLVNGVDSPAWNNLSNTSAVFSHTATPGQFLRQAFFLDGIYTIGPGGNWVIDVPVTTFVTVVPEPSSLIIAVVGICGIIVVRRRLSRRAEGARS